MDFVMDSPSWLEADNQYYGTSTADMPLSLEVTCNGSTGWYEPRKT